MILPLLFFAGAILFLLIAFGISRFLQRSSSNSGKNEAYECGEEAVFPERSFQNFKFYLPALFFLLFELEIVLLAPVLLAQNHPLENWNQADWFLLIKWEAVIFVFLLGIGYLLALRLGYLQWERENPAPINFEGAVPDFAYEQFNLETERRWRNSRQESSV